MSDWHAILNEQGWLAPNWPKEYGGAGWNAVQRHIFEEECAPPARRASCRSASHAGAGAAEVRLATSSRTTTCRASCRGEDWWCQGYSEPGAGSDLASLKTTAERDGDHYIVNGQKTWTTLGQYADWIFCLVRTGSDGKPQEASPSC